MNRKRVWRYYCEYCKKSGCSAGHMKKHEAGCARNPHRKCGYCKAGGLKQQPMKDLIEALGDGQKEGLDRLRDLANGCPMCILAAITQSGIQHIEADEDGISGLHVDFDFKKEREEFWREINRDYGACPY